MPYTAPAALAAACTLLLLDAADAFGAATGTGENTPVNLGGSGAASNTKVPGSSAGSSIVRTVVGLAIVIAVIYGLYWVLKQLKASKEEKASGRGLAPIATLPLGANRSLQLVRAGREIHLVGVSEHGITPVRSYSEDEADAVGLLDSELDEDFVGADGRPAGGPLNRVIDDLRRRTVRR